MTLLRRARADLHPVRLLAPTWLRNAARPAPGPIPVERAVRAAVAVGVPVGLGLALGALAVTTLIGIGALIASTVDRDVPYRQRLLRTGGAVLAGTVGWMLGRTVQATTAGLGWWPVVVAVSVVAVIAALLSTAGNVASLAGLQLLLMTTVSSGRPFPGPVWQPGLLFLTGGAWALGLSLLFGIGRRTVPERRATAAVLYALADRLDASAAGDHDGAAAAGPPVTAALSAAYDTLLTARIGAGGHDQAFQRLFAVLNATTVVTETATTVVRTGERAPRAAVDALRRLARAVRDGGVPTARPRWTPASDAEARLRDALGAVHDVLDGGTGTAGPGWRPPSPRERMAHLRELLAPGPAGWRTVARLVLCMATAEVVAHLDTAQRSYWVPLTVAIVLKPDLGSVFARGLQRGAGTVLGVVLGAAVIEFVPVGPWMIPFVVLFAAIAPIGISRNYGMFSTFLTPLVLLLIDLISRLGTTLLIDRLIDSLVGVGLVLLLGYVIWPESWHVRLGAQVADTVDGLGRYLREALGSSSSTDRATARRRAYRRLGDLRTAFQQAMSEPGRVGRQAVAWWPAVIGLERTTDAVTHTVAAVAAGAPAPPEADVAALHAAIDDLAATVREQRSPAPLALPGGFAADPAGVAGVADELRAVRTTLGGPAGEPATSGRIVDEHGRPVGGALVTVVDADGAQVARVRTGDDGAYRLDPAGGYRLAVHTAPGHDPVARWIDAGEPGTDVVLGQSSGVR